MIDNRSFIKICIIFWVLIGLTVLIFLSIDNKKQLDQYLDSEFEKDTIITSSITVEDSLIDILNVYINDYTFWKDSLSNVYKAYYLQTKGKLAISDTDILDYRLQECKNTLNKYKEDYNYKASFLTLYELEILHIPIQLK